MRRRDSIPAVCLVLLSLVAASHPDAAGAATGRKGGGAGVFSVSTVPALRGVHFAFSGATHVTGAAGTTSFGVSRQRIDVLRNPYGLSRAVRLFPVRRRHGRIFRLQRWYSKSVHGKRLLVAALRELVPTRIRLVDPNAGAFDARRVDRVVVKRSDGAVIAFSGKQLEKSVLLQATRVVSLTGRLVSKNLLYRVQAVIIEGNNLVNRSQQAFEPARASVVRLKLLFYSARFSARDRLFGFRIGSGIRLEYPSHRVQAYAFDDSGEVDLAALPRGDYRVTIDASGLGRTSPVAMTRDQVATLKVFSYLDITVVTVALLSIAVGLLLVGRPALRRRLRRGPRVPVQA